MVTVVPMLSTQHLKGNNSNNTIFESLMEDRL